MFNDDVRVRDIAEFLLSQFELTDLLEMNDITEEEVLTILIEGGYIGEPSRIMIELEGSV